MIVSVVAVALLLSPLVAVRASTSECATLGFSDALLCSTCVEMTTFVHDESVTNECFKCCSEDRESDTRTFSSAILVADTTRLQYHTSVESFIRDHAHKFKDRLKVVSRPWWRPALELLDANEVVVDTLPIDAWEAHQLVQFLEERVGVKQQL
jgi:hypothetical protein